MKEATPARTARIWAWAVLHNETLKSNGPARQSPTNKAEDAGAMKE